MNFLAHIYLSGNNKLLMIGNLIGDTVKGRKYETMEPYVIKGVLMHRAIDDFTDRHPINANIRKLLHPEFGKYSGVYLDMFYDHFLASCWADFSNDTSLKAFCTRFYFDAMLRQKYLPAKIKVLLSSLIVGNRLKNYGDLKHLGETLELMHKYSKLPRTGVDAIKFLIENYTEIKEAFYEFFPLLVNFTRIWREPEQSDNKREQLPDLYLLQFKETKM